MSRSTMLPTESLSSPVPVSATALAPQSLPHFLFVLWEDETTTMLSPSMPCSWRLDLAVSQKQDKGQGGIGALKHTSPKSLLCQAQETQQFEKKNATLGWSARDICASAPSDSITILSKGPGNPPLDLWGPLPVSK